MRAAVLRKNMRKRTKKRSLRTPKKQLLMLRKSNGARTSNDTKISR